MNLTELSIKAKGWIIDILWPKMCLGCGREGIYICKGCETFLSEVDPIISGGPTSTKIKGEVGPQRIVSVWEYEGLMEKLILKIKYDGCYDIIDELVKKAFEKIELNLPENTYITFVPMYKKKEKWRGFNQAELIARKVGEMTGRPVVKLLEKIKDNQSQVGLGPQERAENVKDVFRVTSDVRRSDIPRMSDIANIVVVDDVYTTGSTMGECMKILKKAGVKNVWGFTLSRKMNIQNC
ncbi:MAG: ComF family protein [Candidatus Nealsonbacteria bacterium]